MKVFVTGAGGYIGSHLVEKLLAEGHSVRALVHYNGAGRRGFLDEIRARNKGWLEVVAGDVADPFQTTALVEGCPYVVHLAALIAIPYSYQAAEAYVRTNVSGTLNVLEASLRHNVRRLIVTSTSEVYGTAQTAPMSETHRLNAQSPYAATKIAADQMALAYHRSRGLPVVVLRPFNTYGPRQSARAVLPTILSQLLAGEKALRLGNLSPRRDLTFVTDTADAFARALTAPGIDGEVVHFGSGEDVSVKELARRCMEIVGRRVPFARNPERVRPAAGEVGLLLCDARKARRLLKWSPRVPLEEGLRRTAEYIRQNLGAYRTREYAI